MPYMIMMFIATIFAALGILGLTLKALFSAIVNTAFNGYIFICLKSLHDVFKEEEGRNTNVHYVAAGYQPQQQFQQPQFQQPQFQQQQQPQFQIQAATYQPQQQFQQQQWVAQPQQFQQQQQPLPEKV